MPGSSTPEELTSPAGPALQAPVISADASAAARDDLVLLDTLIFESRFFGVSADA